MAPPPGRSRTPTDRRFRRHIRTVARGGQVWPDVRFSCVYETWLWPGVALYLAPLAPQLAPRELAGSRRPRGVRSCGSRTGLNRTGPCGCASPGAAGRASEGVWWRGSAAVCGVEAAQPWRLADDGDRAGGHRYCGEYGRQDSGGGERYEQQVVSEGPAEVLADDLPGGAGEHDCIGDRADAAPAPRWPRSWSPHPRRCASSSAACPASGARNNAPRWPAPTMLTGRPGSCTRP